MKARIVPMILAMALWAMPAAAQTDRVVALVVSVGGGAQRADDMQTQLQLMGAETLRAHDPNNAQLRSILMRFAREASNARATFIYLDVPAVNFEGRPFILPKGATLKRPTDLFTQAIPIQAFSRSAVQAEQGGAVVITIVPQDRLLDGLSNVTNAPEAVLGASPVLISTPETFAPVLAAMEKSSEKSEVEIGTLLSDMLVKDGISISDLPRNRIFLRLPPKAEPEPVALPAPVSQTTNATESSGTSGSLNTSSVSPDSDNPKQDGLSADTANQSEQPQASGLSLTAETTAPAASDETLEELELLEQTLSRAAKRTVQRALRNQQLYKGLVDGIFGPQTREAIEAFQKSRSEKQTGILTRRQLLDLSS
ncbi:Putative peptidoglycan binding domain-containing protein [Cohaesibacter marisflavi]|uniref:Putative peptidoglycan binding domain-containing protein n=1 Tax=Cohaesibacter marisflavi TaxID=655353 RepID=A0A1I5KH89_9HYPH|nr:peptidoglycan-binding domain-containing protein [Cohaesibacter marisflavi]SFO84415.1 Putative peptidoglycan binding domain-containing protein [Cohaesibacter marisflavi]